jgi:hypothetical protein
LSSRVRDVSIWLLAQTDSIVRRLAFGAASEFVTHAGLYAATVPLSDHTDTGREMFMLNVPGKLAALHPRVGAPLACFVFWHPAIPEFDYTNLDQHKSILERNFTGIGWRVSEFLADVRTASDLYFDSVARVHVADWARGRIVLLGDAASCVSLFGDGSTLPSPGHTNSRGRWRKAPAIRATPSPDTRLCMASSLPSSRRIWVAWRPASCPGHPQAFG